MKEKGEPVVWALLPTDGISHPSFPGYRVANPHHLDERGREVIGDYVVTTELLDGQRTQVTVRGKST